MRRHLRNGPVQASPDQPGCNRAESWPGGRGLGRWRSSPRPEPAFGAAIRSSASSVPEPDSGGDSRRGSSLSGYLVLPSPSLRTARGGPQRRVRGFVAICGIRLQVALGAMVLCRRLLINLDVTAVAGRAAHGPVLLRLHALGRAAPNHGPGGTALAAGARHHIQRQPSGWRSDQA